jgi:hypothetical protein
VHELPPGHHPSVLDGVVLSVEYIRAPRPPAAGEAPLLDEIVATIVVNRQWHSATPDTVQVRTAAQSTACGFGFGRGARHLLFVRQWNGKLYVSKCDPSRLWDEQAERLSKALDTYHDHAR